MRRISPAQKAVSLALKVVVIVCAVWGTLKSAAANNGSFMGGTSALMYFTIQSNIALALLSLADGWKLVANRTITDRWQLLRFVGAVAISVTGGVFCFVLAPTMSRGAWNITNLLTHVIVPIAAVADFFVLGVSCRISKRKVFYVTLPPIAFVIYAAIGYVRGWQFSYGANYPYFFLNWGSPAGAFGFTDGLPFMGCGWWILLLSALIILLGLVYLLIIDGLRKLLKIK